MADPRAASAIDMVRFFFISSNMTLVLELRDTKESNYFKIFSENLAVRAIQSKVLGGRF
jgi:hypothetical protein